MSSWDSSPKWTDFNSINGGQQFSNNLSAQDLNALAENIAYLYNNAGENEYLGEWEEGVAYKKGAIVRDNGNIYLCIKDADGAVTTNTTYWQKLNEGGSVVEDSPLPIKVGSEIEMNALLTNGTVGGVYQYTGTTGTYENGALYVLENDLITFTIDGTSYQAESGMTWYEWSLSDYNTHGNISTQNSPNSYVSVGSSGTSYIEDVRGTDTIIANKAYSIHYGGGGGGSND